MQFLNPQSDIVFKKLFGDITHKNILISFLNSVLGRLEGEKITDVVMNDPTNVPETPLSKTSIVDVRCTDQQGHQYIVEMQVVAQKDYAARAQYYSSLALSRQLASGEDYYKLVPVIFVGVLSFNLFETDGYMSHHSILNRKTGTHELKHLDFHFIELEKFTKEIEELTDILDKWIYFFKHAVKLHAVPPSFKEPVLKEAFDVLAQSNWSKAELEAYDRYLDAIRSSRSQIETAREDGLAKGKEEGKLEEKLNIARNFLDIADVATIAKKTGLSIEQVEELKKQADLKNKE